MSRSWVVIAAVTLAGLALGGAGQAWAGDDGWAGLDCGHPVAGCELVPGPPQGREDT